MERGTEGGTDGASGRASDQEAICLFSSWPQPISRCALENSYEWRDGLGNKGTACSFARQKRLGEGAFCSMRTDVRTPQKANYSRSYEWTACTLLNSQKLDFSTRRRGGEEGQVYNMVFNLTKNQLKGEKPSEIQRTYLT